ncbi:MAG: hypothetical protein AB4058_20490 [Microcystaceae cyanobacterium]
MKNYLLNFAVITATVAIPLVGTQGNAAGVTVGTLDFLTNE